MTRPPAPPSLFFLIKLLMSVVDELQLVSEHQFVRPGPINTVSLQVLSEECSAVIGWWWLGSLVRDVSVTSAQINCDAWTHLYFNKHLFLFWSPERPVLKTCPLLFNLIWRKLLLRSWWQKPVNTSKLTKSPNTASHDTDITAQWTQKHSEGFCVVTE